MERSKGKKRSTSTKKELPAKAPRCRRSPVASLIDKFAEQVKADEIKLSVSDYLRLLQFEREFSKSEGPKKVKVTWIDSQTDRPATER